MEEEEVPSTSGVQVQASGMDKDIVVIPDSESSSGEEGERLPDSPPPPPQKGKKRKRRRSDDASGTTPSQPPCVPQLELGVVEDFGGPQHQTLGKLLHAVSATTLHPNTRAIRLFFGSSILTTQRFLAYAMAVRQGVRDRQAIQATIKCQNSWKLTTTASRWRMGYRKHSSWMYSYSDDVRRPIRIAICVTFACEEGERWNVSYSAGTFKPVRASNYDMVWLTTHRCVGELVELCDPIYHPFFGYLCIFRCLKFIWENVLLPEQRVPFMQFLGFLQKTDNIYMKRFVQEGLLTSNIQTPWLSEDPEGAVDRGWTQALIRGRVLGLSGLGPAAEPDKDATGETQQEAEDMESDDEDEIPRIVSREETKRKDARPPQFLTRTHRLILERTGGLTLRARKALEGPSEPASGGPRRRKECAPEPPLTLRNLHILAGMFRQQFKGVCAPHVSSPPLVSAVEIPRPQAVQDLEPGPVQSPEPGPVQSPEAGPVQSPEPGPVQDLEPGPVQDLEPGPVQDLEPGPVQDLEPGPVQDLEPGPVQSPKPGPTPAPPTGHFVRPWEAAPSQVPKVAPATHMPDPMAGAFDPRPAPLPSLALLTGPAPETSSSVQVSMSYAAPSWAPTPVQPVVPIPIRCGPPPDYFTWYSSRGRPQRYPYTHPVAVQPPEVPMAPTEAPLSYPAMQAGRIPVMRPPSRSRGGNEWETRRPYSLQRPRTVRACLAMMRSGTLGRPPRGEDTETWLERNLSQVAGLRLATGTSAFQGLDQAQVPATPPQLPPRVGAPMSRSICRRAPVIPAPPQLPPMPGQWVFIPDQEPLHEASVRPRVSQGPYQMGAFRQVPRVESPPPEPTNTHAPSFFGVTQYNVSQVSFDEDIEETESADGSEASELCDPIDLSIHGRPTPRTPEVIFVAEDGQNVSGAGSGVVLVSALVHSGQGEDLPDLEDPPDNEE
ncbi:EBNA-3A [Macacine gammaherpesvirus 4]|uniref:EBNA-3A n=1 Tax=Macacine gammaherpesvirus 4 TaxID=45455 RepID=Q9IMY0_9GAMA|nr:EBNA-3A [Macacine gammaherpesvirus 4]AAF78881.2 EBNA-3A [Macacine gammaherpesvirus 4]